MGDHANGFLDTWNFPSKQDGRYHVETSKPDWLFAGEIVESDVLRCAVVNSAHGQYVVVWVHEREEFESWPQFSIETTFKRDLRKKFTNIPSRVSKLYLVGCENAPVVQEFVHRWMLRHEVDWAHR